MNKNPTTLRAINPPGALIPGLSQAMMVEGGRTLYISGHVPMDQQGRMVGEDVAAQLDQVFANVDATLRHAGGKLSQLARITIYVRDYNPAMLPQIRSVRDKWINVENPPASTLIGVSALALPGMLIEVDGVAILPPTTE